MGNVSEQQTLLLKGFFHLSKILKLLTIRLEKVTKTRSLTIENIQSILPNNTSVKIIL